MESANYLVEWLESMMNTSSINLSSAVGDKSLTANQKAQKMYAKTFGIEIGEEGFSKQANLARKKKKKRRVANNNSE